MIYMGNRTEGVAQLRQAAEVCKAKLAACDEKER